MLQGLLWLFDDPFSDLLLAGIFILAALQHRQMRLMHAAQPFRCRQQEDWI